jgi:hypothetical protein
MLRRYPNGLRNRSRSALVIRGVSRVVLLLNGSGCHYRRDGVLENQLLLVAGFKNQRILVETLDPTGEFDAAQKVDGDQPLVFTRIIEKAILNVLRWLIHLIYRPQKF